MRRTLTRRASLRLRTMMSTARTVLSHLLRMTMPTTTLELLRDRCIVKVLLLVADVSLQPRRLVLLRLQRGRRALALARGLASLQRLIVL